MSRRISDIWTKSIPPSPLPIGETSSRKEKQPGKAGTRSSSDFPGLDCGSKYCCPARPHQPSPPPIDCKSQTDFSPLPSGPDNSCKFLQPRNEKEIIRPRMGTWGGSVHSYIRAMTNIANSGDARMTVWSAVCAKASSISQCRRPKAKLEIVPECPLSE